MRKFILASLSICLFTTGWAQKDKKKQDIEAIKSMAGCYKVKFNFTETFNYVKDSTYKPSKTKIAGALEWVQVVKDNRNEIQLQHLLIVGSPTKPHIVKHWRQDWLYENEELYAFHKENHWKYVQLPEEQVTGQWTQKVFQVDDSPRYEGTATWVHVDGKSYWENKADAPLARREYTQRSDYNVLVRRNRHEITKEGWVHDQDNDKVVRKDGEKDVMIAQEKGFNTYTKVDDNKCIAAQEYWKENRRFWKKVRKKWGKIFDLRKDLSLHKKVEHKALFSHLFKMDKKSSRKKINQTIDKFVK